MNLAVLLVLVLGAAAVAKEETTAPRSKVTFFHDLNSQKSCIGSDCFDITFCYRGNSFLALNMAFTEIVGQVEFDTPVDASDVHVDSESEDEYSFKSLLMLHNTSPQDRLLQRQTTGGSMMSRVYQLFTPKAIQEENAHLKSKRFEITFSPFDTTCFQIAAKKPQSQVSAVISLQARTLLDYKLAPLIGLGAALVLTAKRLSVMPEFYYLSGASIGVGFAVSVLVLCFFYLTNDRSSGATSRSHFGIAALVQAAVVFMRKSIFDMMADYMEYVLVYVIVSFSLSLALIHYSLRTETGVVLNPALCDVLHVGLASLGSGIIGFTLTHSPRLQIMLVLITAMYTMLVSSRLFGKQQKPIRKAAAAAYSTPIRRSIVAVEVLQTPEQALDFIAQNHNRFVLRKTPVEYEEEEGFYESDDEEGSEDEEVLKQR